jgi:signal transduction histidine kinase
MSSMNAPADQAFPLYRRGKELLESRLETADGPTAASRLIADAFRALWPGARLCYCRLKCGETLAARALDDNGDERPGWAVALEEPVVRWLDTASSDGSDTQPAPPQTGLFADVHVARIQFRDARLGAAGVVFPADFSSQQEATASAAFEELCSYLGVRLYADECHERQQAALQAREQQTPFCILADLVSPVSHELRNVFNSIVLQAALLRREVAEDLGREVEVIRRLGNQASQMLNRLDDYRHRIAVPRLPLDLNRIATAALAELPPVPGVTVGLDLAPSLPPVPGSENEVRRLLHLLVNNAGTVLQLHGGGTVTVRTGARGNKVLLCVEDDGPVVADDAGKVLEPFVLARAGENSLELGACQGLAGKLRARLRADNRDPSGVVVTAEFDAA